MAATAQWVTANQMADALSIDRQTLFRMRDDGTFKLGPHYAAFKGKTYSRESYLWNQGAVQRTMRKREKEMAEPMS
jgi:hypothetical protein